MKMGCTTNCRKMPRKSRGMGCKRFVHRDVFLPWMQVREISNPTTHHIPIRYCWWKKKKTAPVDRWFTNPFFYTVSTIHSVALPDGAGFRNHPLTVDMSHTYTLFENPTRSHHEKTSPRISMKQGYIPIPISEKPLWRLVKCKNEMGHS